MPKPKYPNRSIGFYSRHARILEGTDKLLGFLGRNGVKLKGGEIKTGFSSNLKRVRYTPESKILHIFNAGCRQEFFCITENSILVEDIIKKLKESFSNFEVHVGIKTILTKKEEDGMRKKVFLNSLTEMGELAHQFARDCSSTKSELISGLFNILINPNCCSQEEKILKLREIIEGLCESKDEKIFAELDKVTHFLTDLKPTEKAKETIRCEFISLFNSLLSEEPDTAIKKINIAIDMLTNPEVQAYDILEAELIRCLELIKSKHRDLLALPCNTKELENKADAIKLEITSLTDCANNQKTVKQKITNDLIDSLNNDKDDEFDILTKKRSEVIVSIYGMQQKIATYKLELEDILKQLYDKNKSSDAIKSEVLLLEMKIDSYARTLRLIKDEITIEDIKRCIEINSVKKINNNINQKMHTRLTSVKKHSHAEQTAYDVKKVFLAFDQLKQHGLFPGIGNNLQKLYNKINNSEILEAAYNGFDELRRLFNDKKITNPSVEVIIKLLKNKLFDNNDHFNTELAVAYLNKRKITI